MPGEHDLTSDEETKDVTTDEDTLAKKKTKLEAKVSAAIESIYQ